MPVSFDRAIARRISAKHVCASDAQPERCLRRWCSRRIFSRLPQVDIEHQRRRPLRLRNSHPSRRPGQRPTRAKAAGILKQGDRVGSYREADPTSDPAACQSSL